MELKRIALLGGADRNCGDHLIVNRATALFRRFLPEAAIDPINRTGPIGEADVELMKRADLVVLAGGPLLVENAAELLNLDGLANDGFRGIDTPFVAVGAGAHFVQPFGKPQKLNPTDATLRLFGRLESSPYVSGVRDYDTLAAMRGSGYGNFTFSACPALFDGENADRPFQSFDSAKVKRIVFSAGSHWLMSEDSQAQQLSVIEALHRAYPGAAVAVAAHHGLVHDFFRTCSDRGFEVVDISGSLAAMEELYRGADLHVGYRVHAHVLMTSWRRPSLLISEDGRGSGMSAVIHGPGYAAWRPELVARHRGFRQRLFRRPIRYDEVRTYDPEIAARVIGDLAAADGRSPLNRLDFTGYGPMADWFAQFR